MSREISILFYDLESRSTSQFVRVRPLRNFRAVSKQSRPRRTRTQTSTGTRRRGRARACTKCSTACTSREYVQSVVGSVQHDFGCRGGVAPHNLDCAGAKTVSHIRYTCCNGIDPAVFSHNLDCAGAKVAKRLNCNRTQTRG